MAIIGGAGNPVSGSFTGAAEALEIYGDFAAAYSGDINQNTALTTHLKFTTGNYLFVGEMSLTGPLKAAAVGDGNASIAEISFNGVVIFKMKSETVSEGMQVPSITPILIPAYTEVFVQVQSGDTTAGYTTSCNLIGRIYR